MNSGERIRQLREERLMKPDDVERASRSIAEISASMEYYISEASLAEMENGSAPSIYKICSLARCFKIPYEQLLLIFGIDVKAEWQETNRHRVPVPSARQRGNSQSIALRPIELSKDGVDFRLNFNAQISLKETHLLSPHPRRWGNIPATLRKRLHPTHFRYAWIGLKDDTMADILPPGSLIEIDKKQTEIQRSPWKSLRERPLYLVRHAGGYSCCWCQLEGNELTLIPHLLSQRQAMHFKTPQQAAVIGRVVNVWMPRQLHNMRTESVDNYSLAPYSTQNYSSGFTAMFESGRID